MISKQQHLLIHEVDGLVQHGKYEALRNYVWHQDSDDWHLYRIKSQETGKYVPFILERDGYVFRQE